MLWKKESTNVDALYVDILSLTGMTNQTDSWEMDRSDLVKSDEISLQKRMEGNALFAQNEWLAAILKYNESLRFAATASEDIGLIYANRSTCLLKMQRYNECLKDIELAIGAGYPEQKMKKLHDRKAECMKGIENGTDVVVDALKLSYEAHERFPCMANVLGFERNSDGYPAIVAKEDIDVGQVIMHEELLFPWSPLNTRIESQHCNVCTNAAANFMPCTRCTTALFCSEECKGNKLNVHDFECGLWKCSDSQMNRDVISTTRQIFKVIKMFATVDELIDFVEEAVSGDPKEMPNESMDAKSQYRTFLRLRGQHFDILSIGLVVHRILKNLLEAPEIIKVFSVQKYRRFLMHLIAQHHQVILSKSYINAGTLTMGYIDYTCTPNVHMVLTVHGVFVFAMRPITKGDCLMMKPGFDRLTAAEHQKPIEKFKGMKCECTRCNGISIPRADRILLQFDSSLKSIKDFMTSTAPCTHGQFDTVIKHCETFLRNSGRMVWCEEIQAILILYIYMFTSRYCSRYIRSTGKLY